MALKLRTNLHEVSLSASALTAFDVRCLNPGCSDAARTKTIFLWHTGQTGGLPAASLVLLAQDLAGLRADEVNHSAGRTFNRLKIVSGWLALAIVRDALYEVSDNGALIEKRRHVSFDNAPL